MFRDVPECSVMFHFPGFIDGHRTITVVTVVAVEQSINDQPARDSSQECGSGGVGRRESK